MAGPRSYSSMWRRERCPLRLRIIRRSTSASSISEPIASGGDGWLRMASSGIGGLCMASSSIRELHQTGAVSVSLSTPHARTHAHGVKVGNGAVLHRHNERKSITSAVTRSWGTAQRRPSGNPMHMGGCWKPHGRADNLISMGKCRKPHKHGRISQALCKNAARQIDHSRHARGPSLTGWRSVDASLC